MRLFLFLTVVVATTLVAAKDDCPKKREGLKEVSPEDLEIERPRTCSRISCKPGYHCVLDDKKAPVCALPCATVCPNIQLNCQGFSSHLQASPFQWTQAENTPCWQIEYDQYTNAPFLRKRCKCPSRNYTESNDCGVDMAHLSNCIQTSIVQQPEINFGDVENVKIGKIQTNGVIPTDIDFQGHVQKSNFCLVDAKEDVEFGGTNECCGCGGIFEHNRVHKMITGDDLQFEEGTTVIDNTFRKIIIGDNFKFDDEDGGPCPTVVTGNYFFHVEIADKCKFENPMNPLTFANNDCHTFVITSGNNLSCTVIPGNKVHEK